VLANADDMRAAFTEEVLYQLANRDAWDAQTIAAVDVQLAAASTIAEGYVAKFYAPAAGRPVPPMLVPIVCDIAFARMHRAPPEEVRDRRADAMKLLLDISKGLVKIDEGKQDLPARDGALIVPASERTFSRDRLGGF
jgi:phage gp36-like protein